MADATFDPIEALRLAEASLHSLQTELTAASARQEAAREEAVQVLAAASVVGEALGYEPLRTAEDLDTLIRDVEARAAELAQNATDLVSQIRATMNPTTT